MDPNELLRQLTVVEPCHEDWGRMEGSETARHCRSCDKAVHNISAMTDEEILAIRFDAPEGACGRIELNAAGEVIRKRPPGSTIARLMTGIAGTAVVLWLIRFLWTFEPTSRYRAVAGNMCVGSILSGTGTGTGTSTSTGTGGDTASPPGDGPETGPAPPAFSEDPSRG